MIDRTPIVFFGSFFVNLDGIIYFFSEKNLIYSPVIVSQMFWLHYFENFILIGDVFQKGTCFQHFQIPITHKVSYVQILKSLEQIIVGTINHQESILW